MISPILSLFGGAILGAAVFALLKKMRVPNFWCGVIAVLLPSVAYIAIYSGGPMPGGDMVTIHLAMFLTVGVVLSIQSLRKRGPNSQRAHWAPKLIAGFFVVVAVVNGALLLIAGQGLPPALSRWLLPSTEGRIHTGFAGVLPHNQESAKAISSFLNEKHRMENVGWTADVVNGDLLRYIGDGEVVRVALRDKNASPVVGARLELEFSRPGQTEGGLIFPAREAQDGVYHVPVRLTEAGIWVVRVRAQRSEDRFQVENTLEIPLSPALGTHRG